LIHLIFINTRWKTRTIFLINSLKNKNYFNYRFAITHCSSIRFPSPIKIGPASAIILTPGWIIVLVPMHILKNINRFFI
jgi:hypothetical protein